MEYWDDNDDPISSAVYAAVDNMGAPYQYNTLVDGVDEQLFRDIHGLTPENMTAVGLDPELTMEQAVNLAGGDFKMLARHSSAGLISAVSGINYPYTAEQVLEMVHEAIVTETLQPTATYFADASELECPLE